MKDFLKTTKGKICTVLIAVLLLAAIAGGAYGAWWYQLPKFQDVTVEFGTTELPIELFLTEHANPEKVSFVTDIKSLDLSVGGAQISLKHGSKEETVDLVVQDTTAPTATFQDIICSINHTPEPADFVVESYDLAETTVSFAKPLEKPTSFGDVTVTVVVTDASGNSVSGDCTISYEWLKESYTMELGSTLAAESLLIDPQIGGEMIPQAEMDALNASGVGEYTLVCTDGEQEYSCVITVQDTTGPVIVTKTVEVYPNREVVLEDFIESVSDLSGDVITRLASEPDTSVHGTYTIVIEAEDVHGNISTAEATLVVLQDTVPPIIAGVDTMYVEKNSSPDYVDDVYAYDEVDGYLYFSYDASRVDTSTAGTYYVTYYATDSSGNEGSARRSVVVEHDAEDTNRLVAEHAAKSGSSIESIRNYVRGIAYNSNWGGDDPVWYGFTTKTGNCYVHALCLQRLLSYHGYSSRLIWVTERSHYWLLVDMGGYWRHVDATPTPDHSRYVFMTDAQRYETLDGRDWDRSAWPAAE